MKEELTIIYQDITELPTGTILVERGNSGTVMYAQNDLHTHVSILVWLNSKTEQYALNYEKYITQPFILDMYIDNTSNISPYCPVQFSQLEQGNSIFETTAYKPKKELTNHSKYLEVVSNIIDIFRVLFLRNLCYPMFAYKYLPNLFESFTQAPNNPLVEFYSFKNSKNPLKDVIEQNIRTRYSCVDICSLFVKILYKELFDKNIFENSKNILINDFINTDSQLFEAYDTDSKLAIHTDKTIQVIGGIFSATFVLSIIIFVFLVKFLPIVIKKIFSPHQKILH